KLLAFYQEGLSRVGWNNYSRINVAFENEVVCTRKDGTPPPRPTPPKIDSADVEMALATGSPALAAAAKAAGKPAAGTARSKARATPKRQPKAVYKKPAGKKRNTTQKHRTP